MNGSRDLLEQMSGPDNLSSLWWHVPHSWGILLGVFVELLLDGLKISGVDVKDVVVLVLELMSEGVSFQDVLELCQEFQGVFDVTEFGEVLIDEVLELGV